MRLPGNTRLAVFAKSSEGRVKFSFGCELNYAVAAPTVFIFNIEAADIPAHHDLRGTLSLSTDLPRDTEVTAPFGNRYTRIFAPSGPLTVTYCGSVALAPVPGKPEAIGEIAIADLPLDLFAYLQPSRFCESDRLTDFATQEFNTLEPVFPVSSRSATGSPAISTTARV